jgi:hypothetical protein
VIPVAEEPLEVINRLVILFRENLGLDQKHVVTYNQMIPIPPDETLFVAVGILDSKPYASSLSYRDTSTPGNPQLTEHQSANTRDVFSIHFMSRNNEARRRRHEFIFAVTGTRAQQMQDAHGFAIARLPIGLVDASITEGAERLNRYNMTLAVLSVASRSGPVDFFDSYKGSPALVTQP